MGQIAQLLRDVRVVGLLALLTGASEAATVEDLYQARTILTGQGEEGRPKGLAECLTDVLAKVSGDPKLLTDPRVAAMGPQAPAHWVWPDGHWHVPAMHDSPSQQGTVGSQGAWAGRHPRPWHVGSLTAM